MSQAGKQSITLLAMITGILKTMMEFNMVDNIENTMNKVVYAHSVCFECARTFPITNDNPKSLKWIEKRLKKIDKFLLAQKVKYDALLMINISLTIITDLTERIKEKSKINKLNDVYEAIKAISDDLDPDSSKFNSYELSDELLKEVYKIIGFIRR